MGHSKGQSNPLKGWMCMSLYWAAGYAIGLREGYWGALFDVQQWGDYRLTKWHWVGLLTTVECQRRMVTRFTNYERTKAVLPVVVFALFNAIFETFWFLFVYDVGRKYIAGDDWSQTASVALGFSIYYVYAAVIHIAFWLPYCFPTHTKSTAPPFHKHGLPLLTMISISWFILYEVYHDVSFVCFLHFIVNVWGCYNMGLWSPFAAADTKAL